MNKKKIALKLIGRRCKEWRVSKGLSQNDIAKIANVTIPVICDFEHGRNDSCVYIFAYVLQGMDIQDLIEIWSNVYHVREK